MKNYLAFLQESMHNFYAKESKMPTHILLTKDDCELMSEYFLGNKRDDLEEINGLKVIIINNPKDAGLCYMSK